MIEIFTNLWLYAFLLLIIIFILILMKLNIMAPKDPEVRLAQRAQELIKKEKELSQK